jgi:protocatechuate 3,4-dioxygenase beta subunit
LAIGTVLRATVPAPTSLATWIPPHCDAVGRYSMYSSGVTNENFLRGVQLTDQNGEVAFTTIFQLSTRSVGKIKTSQLALPEDICDTVYATNGYESSVANLANISLTSDMVFRDGIASQLAAVSGTSPMAIPPCSRLASMHKPST